MTNDLEKEIAWIKSEKYHGKESEELNHDIERLKSGEPLAYIIENIPFLGCTIDLTHKPLIPRTETEFWVERALSVIRDHSNSKEPEILDVFSGSGCIGVALAAHLPNSHVDFAEQEPELLDQIKINVLDNKIHPSRFNIFKTDCFEGLPEKKYDYIFANPPYLSSENIEHIQTSVLIHEPHMALFAKENGNYFLKKLLREGNKHLKDEGTIFIEMDPHQKDYLTSIAKTQGCAVEFWNDQFKNIRVAVVTY